VLISLIRQRDFVDCVPCFIALFVCISQYVTEVSSTFLRYHRACLVAWWHRPLDPQSMVLYNSLSVCNKTNKGLYYANNEKEKVHVRLHLKWIGSASMPSINLWRSRFENIANGIFKKNKKHAHDSRMFVTWQERFLTPRTTGYACAKAVLPSTKRTR
jgi:hypothetical protein